MENTDFIEINASSEEEIKKISGLSKGAYKILVPYSAISFGGEKYNEAYLAALRDSLKALEGNGAVFAVSPCVQAPLSGIDDALELTAAYKHCARRLKDCANLAGFEVPKCFAGMERSDELAEIFKAELLEKHPNYMFL